MQKRHEREKAFRFLVCFLFLTLVELSAQLPHEQYRTWGATREILPMKSFPTFFNSIKTHWDTVLTWTRT